MTDRATLLALAERVEAATATEQREMLEAAFVAVHGPKPERVHGGTSEWIAWLDLHNPFFALLQAGGFLDAAMSLVPSGAWFVVKNVMGPQPISRDLFVADVLHPNGKDRPIKLTCPCATPALALTASACRAIAGSLPND